MNKLFILTTILFTIFIQSSFANISPSKEIEKSKLMIGYYGRSNTASLGILGQTSIDEVVKKMKKKAEYFNEELDNKVEIEMAFHLIHSLATKDPGRRNDYLLGLNEKTVMKYINRANKEGFAVIIDLQLGTKFAYEAVPSVLKYLKYDNVHLAIDPEFKIPKHRKYPPGKYVGHIFANDLNKTQEIINEYMIKNNLKGKRNLIVHMFHPRMLRKKEEVKKFDNIELVYNIDGHGNPAVKIKIYNALYTQDEINLAKSGFKIFYNNDSQIMTPKQIMGWEPIKGRQIWTQPYYINYQ